MYVICIYTDTYWFHVSISRVRSTLQLQMSWINEVICFQALCVLEKLHQQTQNVNIMSIISRDVHQAPSSTPSVGLKINLRRTSSDKLKSNAIIKCQHTAQNYASVLRCRDNVLWYGCCKERMMDKNHNLDDLRTSFHDKR